MSFVISQVVFIQPKLCIEVGSSGHKRPIEFVGTFKNGYLGEKN
jgi:hypothetical protein